MQYLFPDKSNFFVRVTLWKTLRETFSIINSSTSLSADAYFNCNFVQLHRQTEWLKVVHNVSFVNKSLS